MRRWFSSTIKDLIVITKHLIPVSPYFNDTIIFKDGNLNEKFREFYLWCMVSMLSCVQLFVNLMDRLLCPWDSPGKNTGVRCHFQSVFLTQEIKALFPAVAGEFFTSCATWEALCLGAPSQNGTTMLRSQKQNNTHWNHIYISLFHGCVLYWSVLEKIPLILEVKFSQYTYNDWFLLLENTCGQNIVTKSKCLGTEIVIAYREESIINQKSGYLDISSSFSSDLWSKCWIYLELVILVYTMKVNVSLLIMSNSLQAHRL